MTRRFVGFGGSAGGGSGTVTNTGGALTANAVVLGAGGSDTKVSTGITTNGSSELDLGVAAGAAGVLGLNGSTSGKVTATATATANGVSITGVTPLNVVLGTPNSVAGNMVFSSSVNTVTGGFSIGTGSGATSANAFGFWPNLITPAAGNATMVIQNSGNGNGSAGTAIINTATYSWSSNASANNGNDTGLSRTAANVVSVGNGTASDETGLVRAANGVRVTGDITLTVNTAITIFSFSLPALAKAWGWQAVIPWIISAGSGTNTISVGVNYTQTPTGTTGAQARIVTTNSPVAEIAGYVPLSATGATNILTSGTITPGASLLQAYCSGTLLASATAGTFTITMTAAGTTATALAKAGATCWFY